MSFLFISGSGRHQVRKGSGSQIGRSASIHTYTHPLPVRFRSFHIFFGPGCTKSVPPHVGSCRRRLWGRGARQGGSREGGSGRRRLSRCFTKWASIHDVCICACLCACGWCGCGQSGRFLRRKPDRERLFPTLTHHPADGRADGAAPAAPGRCGLRLFHDVMTYDWTRRRRGVGSGGGLLHHFPKVHPSFPETGCRGLGGGPGSHASCARPVCVRVVGLGRAAGMQAARRRGTAGLVLGNHRTRALGSAADGVQKAEAGLRDTLGARGRTETERDVGSVDRRRGPLCHFGPLDIALFVQRGPLCGPAMWY